MTRQLLIMAKQPVAGTTKTRLCPPLTPAQAADLYAALLRDTVALARAAAAQDATLCPAIAYAPATARSYFRDLAPDLDALAQAGADLGARLDHVLTQSLAAGHAAVAAMASDCPTLPVARIGQAFARLDDDADVVLGPGDDGGYYLIAVKQPQPAILRPVQMSTPHVLADTLALAQAAGLRVALLDAWPDVDTVDDVRALARALVQLPGDVAPATRAALSGLEPA